MRKMQKIAALGLAGTMALSLAACGGSGDSTADSASTAESTASSTEATAESTGSGDEAVTLNWALWDKDSTAYWQALADGYMESHPNVTIEMTDLGSTDYMTQLATQLAGGNGELDVLSIKDIPGYSNLINLGMLEPLSGKLTTDESKFNGVLEQLTAEDGNYYAVPFRSDFWVVYYNKDIFDQAGVEYPTNDMTMADFDAKIREVNEKAGVYGNIYHTWRSTTTLFSILDGQHTVIDGNYDFLKPYYEQVLSEQADGVIPNYGEQKTSGLHYSGAFENGQAAMCNMGSWFIATLQKYNAEAASNGVQPVNFGIVKYPHPDGDTCTVEFSAAAGLCGSYAGLVTPGQWVLTGLPADCALTAGDIVTSAGGDWLGTLAAAPAPDADGLTAQVLLTDTADLWGTVYFVKK